MGQLLESSTLPGVMLLFPLRFVGSLIEDMDTRSRILAQLDLIYQDGYVVANRVREDLTGFWELKGCNVCGRIG